MVVVVVTVFRRKIRNGGDKYRWSNWSDKLSLWPLDRSEEREWEVNSDSGHMRKWFDREVTVVDSVSILVKRELIQHRTVNEKSRGENGSSR